MMREPNKKQLRRISDTHQVFIASYRTLPLQREDSLRWLHLDPQKETWQRAAAYWTPWRYSSGYQWLESGPPCSVGVEKKGKRRWFRAVLNIVKINTLWSLKEKILKRMFLMGPYYLYPLCSLSRTAWVSCYINSNPRWSCQINEQNSQNKNFTRSHYLWLC